MTIAVLAAAFFLASIAFQGLFLAGCLRRIADALEAQNAHYGIAPLPPTATKESLDD